jgi:hypothetical protein
MTLSRSVDDLGGGDDAVRVGRGDRQRAVAAEIDHEPSRLGALRKQTASLEALKAPLPERYEDEIASFTH